MMFICFLYDFHIFVYVVAFILYMCAMIMGPTHGSKTDTCFFVHETWLGLARLDGLHISRGTPR